jgi:hypothetical protein
MFTYPAILALLLTVALTGCQQESSPQAGDAFRFSVGAVGVSSAPTKAYAYEDPENYLTKEGSSVQVWSQIKESGSWGDLFSSPAITLSKASNWTPSETKYWTRSASYRFRAVAPANAPGLVTTTSSSEKIEVSYDFHNINYDLMVASVPAGTLGSAAVSLLFRHACAAVRFFILDPELGDNTARYSVRKFELKDLYTWGTFTSAATDSWELGTSRNTAVYLWEATEQAAYWPVPAPNENNKNEEAAFTDWFYFVPQPLTDSKGTACISLEFKAGDQILPVSKDLKDLCDSWEAGKKYTYIITIEPKGIDFDVQWTEWTEADHDYGTIG